MVRKGSVKGIKGLKTFSHSATTVFPWGRSLTMILPVHSADI